MSEKRIFLFMAAILLAAVLYTVCVYTYDRGNIAGGNVPKPAQYDLSEKATCMKITDYSYDENGRLVKTTEYCYVGYLESVDKTGKRVLYYYDDKSKWYQRNETLLFYDDQDRLVKTEKFVSNISSKKPYYMVEYKYDQDGGYSETGSVQGNFDYEKTYDGSGRLISDITTSKDDSFYYHYNENGDLNEVTYKYSDAEITTASLRYNDTGSVSVQNHRSGSYYAIWLDHYNENKDRVSSYWYLALSRDFIDEYSPEEIESVSVPSYLAHYDGERLIDSITANEWERSLKPNHTNTVKRYEFCDYDEDGHILWHYKMGTSDTKLYASQYLYDDNQLVREVYYMIEGDWEHTLYDGSVIEIHRDDNEKPVEIRRKGRLGTIMYSYLFMDDLWGGKLLAYTINGDNDETVNWMRADKKLKELDGQEESGMDDGENSVESPKENWILYRVKKGDCLWNIAEKLMNDGRRWPELYELNRAVIGGNPALILEGTELRIPNPKIM